MSPPRRKCVFNDILAKKYPFLKKTKSESDVHCEICKAEFKISNAGKSDIEKHLQTEKHKKALHAASKNQTVTNYFTSSADLTTSAFEGVWAYHVIQANHSFKSSDCASKIFRTCFELRKFHCARTKCEAIATNVFAPFAQNELEKDLLKSNFVSISTDASNHGNVKMMPVVIRYFIPTIGVRVKLLEFSSEKGETSKIIADLILSSANKNKIGNKIIAYSADNCATNFGSADRSGENNVFFRLKQLNKNLIGVGCGAHIIHNALKWACDVLPFDIECIVVKIYSHFYIYTVRVEALKSLCEQEDVEYKKLLGYSKTRFLALGPAIASILHLFDTLKSYFLNLGRRCPVLLKSFFESPLSKFWLLFVKQQVIYLIFTYSYFY